MYYNYVTLVHLTQDKLLHEEQFTTTIAKCCPCRRPEGV